ncbi:E3 ubiquitin-protein ligase BRE1-like 1, partial [Cucurbita argyrosperma subsp. sororia]
MREGGDTRRGETGNPSVTEKDGLTEGLIPKLFNSVPVLNDAASYVAQTTSYFTRFLSDRSVDPKSREPRSSALHEEELVTFPSEEPVATPATTSGDQNSSAAQSIVSESPEAAIVAPAVHTEVSRTTVEDSSGHSSGLQLSNNTGGKGMPIFQGLIDRALRTVRGSADDIGWLQRASGMPPVEDGTDRFVEILEDIRHGIHKLPDSVVYLLVPGLFSNHGPLYFVDTKTRFSKMGLACHIAKIHSEASVEKNAREIKEYVEEIYWGAGKRVLILGHSKGGVDAAAALSLYWSDLREKVAGLALAQSPYGGTPIASDILREGQLGDYVNVRKLMEILICKVIKGDMQALEDLTYEKRKKFLMQHQLPAELPVVSFHTEASISPAVLATLSRVAHAELPTPLSTAQAAKLPVVIPLGAAMAACAQLLQIRYKEKSDGLVTCRDAEVPGSTVVHPKRKLDHAWMVYSSLNNDTSEADASQCLALVACGSGMESTFGPDRKRRHFSTISPTAATAQKTPILPISANKKFDVTVLQYQNQKLAQKIEVQKVESKSLQNKYARLKDKQEPYDITVAVVKNCWEELVNGLETSSVRMRRWRGKQGGEHTMAAADGSSSSFEDAVLSRLAETGATQSSSTYSSSKHIEQETESPCEKTNIIKQNIDAAIENLWYLKDGLHATLLNELPKNDSFRIRASGDLIKEVRNMRLRVKEFLFKKKMLAKELQNHRDLDAKAKAELKCFKVELESAVAELEESNSKLAKLRAEHDAAKRAGFPVLNLAGKHAGSGKVGDKQKDLRDEPYLKELKDQAVDRLAELNSLHQERLKMLQQLSDIRNRMKSVKSISSSQSYLLLRDRIEKLKSEVYEQQALFEKLQIEKFNITWREKELNIKNNILDILRRSSTVSDTRINDLEMLIQKQKDEKKSIESKLAEVLKEPGRKKIVSEFRALVSSFPEAMGSMQSQLHKCKEAATNAHSVRADMLSLSSIIDRMEKECESLSSRSKDQIAEIQKLQAMVQDFTEVGRDLKLIIDMYRRESTDSRGVLEARDLEYKAWARVQSLKSSLDERNLESRVKTANEAEAISQQRLAAAEAEIARLRQKLESSKRDLIRLTDVVKSKGDENVAYFSEIETIGQAYDDMQTQNQHLLQQITERDEYNIKLRGFSDHIQKIEEGKLQDTYTLENTKKRLNDIRIASQQMRESLDQSQSKVEKSRATQVELQIELEKERFEKKRIEEEIEVVGRKFSRLEAQMKSSSVVERLHGELGEYETIVNCKICVNSRKQVVITKCFHLFCNPCVQDILKSQHRKCPRCSATFGPNDVHKAANLEETYYIGLNIRPMMR